jgi:hypothetical protein
VQPNAALHTPKKKNLIISPLNLKNRRSSEKNSMLGVYQRDFRGEIFMIISIGSKRAAIDASRSRREEAEVGF